MANLQPGFGFEILLDEGLREFAEAAALVCKAHSQARFQLLGGPAGDNSSAVPAADLARWGGGSIVEQLGVQDDVGPFIGTSDCVVLPSYRTRSLIEGVATGRPLIASDVPGCRDVIDDRVNVLLCEVPSAVSLPAAMERMLR